MNKDYINEETEVVNEFLNESCFYCQVEFSLIDEVLVDVENDRYVCEDCARELDIKTVAVIEGE